MRRAVQCIVLVIFMLYVESVPMIWVTYYLFSDQIAAAYCVNPTDPCCHGRCHIAEVTDHQQKKENGGIEINIEKPFPFTIVSFHITFHTSDTAPGFAGMADDPLVGYRLSIEHPPPVSIHSISTLANRC